MAEEAEVEDEYEEDYSKNYYESGDDESGAGSDGEEPFF